MKVKNTLMAAAITCLSACSSIDSDDLKTSGISVNYRAISEGNGTTSLEAQFYAGNGGANSVSVDLKEGDIAKVYYGNNQVVSLIETEAFGGYTYKKVVNVGSAGATFRFALERAEDIGAPNSSIYLPNPFSVSSEQSGEAVLYTDPITVNWDGENSSDTRFSILRMYQCLDAEDGEFIYADEDDYDDATGTAVINDSGLFTEQNLSSCVVTIELGRITSAGVDERFKGGASVGIQRRRLIFSMVFSEPEAEVVE